MKLLFSLFISLFLVNCFQGQTINDSLIVELGGKQRSNYTNNNAVVLDFGNVIISYDTISKSLLNYSYNDSMGNYFMLSNKEVIDSISNFSFHIPSLDSLSYDYFMASQEFSLISFGNDTVMYETYYYTDGLVQKIKSFKSFDSCRLDVTLGEKRYLSEVDDLGNGIMRVYNNNGELIDVFLLEKYHSVLHEKIK